MTYSTLIVHLDLGAPNEALLRVTADLAQRFNAGVIGIVASQSMTITYGDGYMSGELIEQERAETERETSEAETRFRAALDGRASTLEWRSTVNFMLAADYIAQEARAADLLITGSDQGESLSASPGHVTVGDLVMRAGRPVLVVPPGADRLDLDSIVVGWKDTRETRRAVGDALPLLQKAGHVTVMEIAADAELPAARDRLEDVVAWLARHGVVAEALAVPSTGDDATRLDAIAQQQGAGLLVAGAYGHNRLREWMFGGVTRDLLLRPQRCSLVSH